MPAGSKLERKPLVLKKPVFTIEEKEWLCSFDPTPQKEATQEDLDAIQHTKEWQKEIARNLSESFEQGNEETTRDPWKAHEYRQKAGLPSEPPGNMFFRTDTFYRYHAWWLTGIRLLLVRVNRIVGKVAKSFLPSFFAFFGLSYGIGFALDLFIVLTTTFSPKLTPQEREANEGFWKRTWTRFKNIITKGNRPYRMMNDFVWFTVNLIVLCTAGPLYLLLNPILNLVGFGFDTTHEFFWLGRETQKHQRLISKLNQEIRATENLLAENQDNQQLKNDLLRLNLVRDKIKEKRNAVIRQKLWISCWTAVVMVGMILVYFPPTTIPGAFLIGSGLALIGGSLFTGLGRRLYLYAESYFPKIVKWYKSLTEPDNKPTNEPKEKFELSTYTAIELHTTGANTAAATERSLTPPSAPLPRSRSRSFNHIEDFKNDQLKEKNNILSNSTNVVKGHFTHRRAVSASCGFFKNEFIPPVHRTSDSLRYSPIKS